MLVGNSIGLIPTPDFDDDIDDESFFLKPCLHQNYQYISPNKLALYLSDPTSHSYDCIRILDARFSYEYKGGKIFSALNVTLFSTMIKIFERSKFFIDNGKSICVVIYCEFSSERGPKLYDMFRDYDRNINIANHPKLTFPDLFLLEGGYSKFYSLYPKFCHRKYVQMYDQEYINNGLIKVCKRNYFADYKDFLTMKQNQNLKLNFKFELKSEQDSCLTETSDDQDLDLESQPKTVTDSTVLSNLSLSNI